MNISGYREFLLEKQEDLLLDLITESVFIMSDDMADIMKEIEDKYDGSVQEIATIFNRLDLEDVDTNMSYFDITNDNNTIKFVSTSKGDKLRSDKGYTVKDVINKAKGNSVRIGRLVRKVISIWNKQYPDYKYGDYLDKDIEDFVNAYKANYDFNNNIMDNFKLFKGHSISDYYYCENYWDESSGTLGSSCMKDSPETYFDIYVSNDAVEMLVLLAPNSKVMGRAIVWTLTDGSKFMDRIYTNRDSDVELFKKYARDKKWIYKQSQDMTANAKLKTPEDNYEGTSRKQMKVDVHKIRYDSEWDEYEFPYMDTMKYYYYEKGILSNIYSLGGYFVELTSTEGNPCCDECYGDVVDCYECGGYGEHECRECEGRGEVECYDCEGEDYEECSYCDDGEVECGECHGSGEVTCQECDGGERVCSQCGGYAKE